MDGIEVSSTMPTDDISFSSSSSMHISALEALYVSTDDDGQTITVLFGWRSESSEKSLPSVHVKKVATILEEGERMTSRDRIWINNVLVIDEEMIFDAAKDAGELHYRQWYSHGWKMMDITARGVASDGLVDVKGRSWRESGLVDQSTQLPSDE